MKTETSFIRIMNFISLLFVLAIFPISSLSAQFWIAGDTIGFTSIHLEQSFNPDVSVLFDIDCDGQVDFSINSYEGNQPWWPWDRLSINKAAGVEVLNSGVGLVSTFDSGDTVSFDDFYWTTALDFIYGIGELGNYGHPFIENKYLAFRKNDQDTSYFFLRFSNQTINFTIHDIVSNCDVNPLEVITAVATPEMVPPVSVFPNPFSEHLTIAGGPVEKVRVLDIRGIELTSFVNQTDLKLGFLSSGVYWVEVVGFNEERHLLKVVKK